MKFLFGKEIDINYADIHFLKNEHSYAAFLGILSTICMKAHASSNIRSMPYQAAIIISSLMMTPYKKQPESSFDRLVFLISKLKIPAGGIDIGIFLSNDNMFTPDSKVGLKHPTSYCWPLKSNLKNESITANVPGKQLNSGLNIVRFFTKEQLEEKINISKYIDYNYKIEYVFRILENSKIHICYQGGTAWLSIAMGIDTIIVHNVPSINYEHHLKFKIFGQEMGNINILMDDKIGLVRVHPLEHHITIDELDNKIMEIEHDNT